MRLLDVSRTLYYRGRQRLHSPVVLLGDWAVLGEPERRLISALERDGFALIPGFYSATECAQLVEEVNAVFKSNPSRLWRSEDGADTRAFAAETLSERILRFNRDPFLWRLGEKFMHQQLEPFFTLAGHIRPTPGNLGSGGGWHRDTAAEHQFKALVYLTDTHESMGAFQYVPGSHRLRSFVRAIAAGGAKFGQHRFDENEVARICESLGVAPQSFPAPAGTLLLVDSSGIHRGMPIVEGERYALTTYFFTPDEVADLWRRGKFVNYFVGPKEHQ